MPLPCSSSSRRTSRGSRSTRGISTGAAELIRGSLVGALGKSAYGRAFGAIALARCAAERGDRAQAEELLEEADRELASEGLVLDPADRPEYERTRELTGLPKRPG